MKVLSTVLTVVMIAFSSLQVSANDIYKKPVSIKEQISKILSNTDFDIDRNTATKVLNIQFMVNKKNEIVVLTTNANEYDAKVKSVLNYQKLSGEGLAIAQPYQISVKLVKE